MTWGLGMKREPSDFPMSKEESLDLGLGQEGWNVNMFAVHE